MCLKHSALPFSQVRNRRSHNDNSHLIGCTHWRWREHSGAEILSKHLQESGVVQDVKRALPLPYEALRPLLKLVLRGGAQNLEESCGAEKMLRGRGSSRSKEPQAK
jgi:hypothetical protein